MFHGENDRVKLLVLYCGILEDERLVRAASGALAMMAHDRIVSNKITTVGRPTVCFPVSAIVLLIG